MLTTQEIKREVLNLPPEEQASIACWIITHLDSPLEDEASVDEAWKQESIARVNEVRNGTATLIPAAEMWAKLMAKYEGNC